MVTNTSFNSILKGLSESSNICDFLFIYYGKINQDIIVSAINLIENKLIIEDFEKTLISKAKIISVEILQNILKHQFVHENIFPYFILGKNMKSLVFYSGNVISNNEKELLINNFEKLKTIKNNIRENYMFALKNNKLSCNGNAGIGLIDISYRSGNNIEFCFDNLDKQLYTYNIQVLLN